MILGGRGTTGRSWTSASSTVKSVRPAAKSTAERAASRASSPASSNATMSVGRGVEEPPLAATRASWAASTSVRGPSARAPIRGPAPFRKLTSLMGPFGCGLLGEEDDADRRSGATLDLQRQGDEEAGGRYAGEALQAFDDEDPAGQEGVAVSVAGEDLAVAGRDIGRRGVRGHGVDTRLDQVLARVLGQARLVGAPPRGLACVAAV